MRPRLANQILYRHKVSREPVVPNIAKYYDNKPKKESVLLKPQHIALKPTKKGP